MARKINRLTARQVTTITKPGAHADGNGLYLLIDENRRYWFFRYSRQGRERHFGIGPTHTWSLAEAREKARGLRQMLAEGRDPLDEKRAGEASAAVLAAKGYMTFDRAAEEYISTHEISWSSEMHRRQWVDTLARYASPIIGSLDVASIDTDLVLKVLKQPVEKDGPLWTARPETASRLRSRIELILGWACSVGHRKEGLNPARLRGHLQNLLPKLEKVKKVEHHAALDFTDIAAFLAELRNKPTMGARALELLILTATRTAEARLAEWKEFDLDAKVWTIPKERMKLRKEHRVPLSPAAVALLERMKAIRHDDFVFPSTRGAIARIDRELMDLRPGMTVHGFRSSFRDWASKRSGFQREHIELCLAHQVANSVERAYWRDDALEERRRIMDAWGEYCNTPAAASGGNVTPIRKAANEVPA